MKRGGALRSGIRDLGPVVPLPWLPLSLVVRPRAGYLVVILGAPGVGKSTVGIQWAYSIVDRPVLVCSLDTDLASQAIRVRAMLEDRSTASVEDEIESRPEGWDRFFETVRPQVRWSHVPMSADDLDELIVAETEFLGETPALVVVDVVGDLTRKEALEDYSESFKSLHRTARRRKTVVVALHHLRRGQAASGAVKFALDEGLYSGERGAEVVLGLWQPSPSTVIVSVLKNRMGRADRRGDLNYAFAADLSRARIGRTEVGR